MQSEQEKTKRMLPATYPKGIAKGSSLNRKDTTKKGILEYQEGRKNNGKRKTMRKFDRLSSSRVLSIMLIPVACDG